MGENNAIAFGRQRRVSRDSFLAAAAVYDSLYRNEHGVPATFQVLYLAGWAPADGQQQPDARGSAQVWQPPPVSGCFSSRASAHTCQLVARVHDAAFLHVQTRLLGMSRHICVPMHSHPHVAMVSEACPNPMTA